MLNLMRSPTRARTVGPGTWSPKVQALNFTPGAISTILCVVSRRTFFTGAGSRGASFAPVLSDPPSAKAPLWRSLFVFEGGESSTRVSLFPWAYAPPARASAMQSANFGFVLDISVSLAGHEGPVAMPPVWARGDRRGLTPVNSEPARSGPQAAMGEPVTRL